MKEQFTDKLRLSKSNIERLSTINSILEEYQAEGYVLTLRQLYYQLVSRNIIPNELKEYAKLSSLLTKGRMAGVVDWSIIEDRIRRPHLPYWVTGIPDAINDIISQYRLDRQRDQETYIELWVEKDALSGVLKRITNKYHIRLMINRGYSSTSAMYDAHQRFKKEIDCGKRCVILYLGDHDPSGLDMIRDIGDRLGDFFTVVDVMQIGLTMEQIKQYAPPPNPAKVTDPRAKWYIQEYGNTSWEVDALPPPVLNKLVEDNILNHINLNKFNSIVELESSEKEELKEFMQSWEGSED